MKYETFSQRDRVSQHQGRHIDYGNLVKIYDDDDDVADDDRFGMFDL